MYKTIPPLPQLLLSKTKQTPQVLYVYTTSPAFNHLFPHNKKNSANFFYTAQTPDLTTITTFYLWRTPRSKSTSTKNTRLVAEGISGRGVTHVAVGHELKLRCNDGAVSLWRPRAARDHPPSQPVHWREQLHLRGSDRVPGTSGGRCERYKKHKRAVWWLW